MGKEEPLEHFQCFIERDGKTSTCTMWLGPPLVNGAPVGKECRFLLAARKLKRLTGKEYVISTNPNSSKGSAEDVVGGLRSNLLKTKFSIYETQPLHTGAVPNVKITSGRHCSSSKVSPGGGATSVKVGHVTSNIFPLFDNSMKCSLLTIPATKGDGPFLMKMRVEMATQRDLEFFPWDPTAILHYRKCGKGLYALEYRYPLSAVQAFALFLSDSSML